MASDSGADGLHTLRPSAAPMVSVIIPVYNVATLAANALESVFRQTFADYEVIVVNDGSSDTPELERALAPYRDRLLYLVQENRGPSAARNAGILAARGQFVAFLDADDEWLPHYLEDQTARAAADPGASIFFGNAEIFGDVVEAGRRFMDLSPSTGKIDFRGLVTRRCTVMTSAMVYRDLFARVGMFDEQLRSSEDFDLWLRAAQAGLRFNYTPSVLSRYRRRGGSLSADPVWMSRHAITVLAKCLECMRLSPDERHVVIKQQELIAAELRFYEGKRAFFQGDMATAREALREANRVLRSAKVAVALLMLRTAPRLLWLMYNARDRVLFRGARTKY